MHPTRGALRRWDGPFGCGCMCLAVPALIRRHQRVAPAVLRPQALGALPARYGSGALALVRPAGVCALPSCASWP
jgi:hypothetical protein